MLLALQLAGQLSQVAWMPKRLDAVYTRYGWDPMRWFRPGYPLPDGSFPSIPGPDLMRMEVFQARNWERIPTMLPTSSSMRMFSHANRRLRKSSCLGWPRRPSLGRDPPELRGSMTIALNSQPQPFGLIPDAVRAASEVQQKIRTIRDSADLLIGALNARGSVRFSLRSRERLAAHRQALGRTALANTGRQFAVQERSSRWLLGGASSARPGLVCCGPGLSGSRELGRAAR